MVVKSDFPFWGKKWFFVPHYEEELFEVANFLDIRL
jgi:hypothetical protein